MAERPGRTLAAWAVVLSLVDCINRGDLDGLLALVSEDHVLKVLDEPPIAGKERARDGWRGYFSAFLHHVVYPRRMAETDAGAAILGHTTGSCSSASRTRLSSS